MADDSLLFSESDTGVTVPVQRVRATDQLFRERLVAAVDDCYRLAAVILVDQREAEDAAHDALERAWRARRSLRDTDRFEAWFQRIVVNACRDRLRRRRSVPPGVSIERSADGGLQQVLRTAGADPFAASAQREALSQALAQLSVDHRICLVLRFYLDLDIDEIARRTNARSGTVKSRIHRGLSQLRAAWEAAERQDQRDTEVAR